jgi:hypothetical protein
MAARPRQHSYFNKLNIIVNIHTIKATSFVAFKKLGERRDLNPQPLGSQPSALPIELRPPYYDFQKHKRLENLVKTIIQFYYKNWLKSILLF